MIAQPQTALRISPAVSNFPSDTVPRLAVAPPSSPSQRPAIAGLIQVFTCVHRNFFTQVMAQALRNAGQGTPTLVVQFLKGGCHQGPERPMKFGQALDWVRLGLQHCINVAPQTDAEVEAIRALWTFTQAAIASGKYDAVVLDELSLAIAYGVIPEAEVVAFLRDRPGHVEVTLTGQKMPQALLKLADQVTELRNVFTTVLASPPSPGAIAVASDNPHDSAHHSTHHSSPLGQSPPPQAAPILQLVPPARATETAAAPPGAAPAIAKPPLMQLGLAIAGVGPVPALPQPGATTSPRPAAPPPQPNPGNAAKAATRAKSSAQPEQISIPGLE